MVEVRLRKELNKLKSMENLVVYQEYVSCKELDWVLAASLYFSLDTSNKNGYKLDQIQGTSMKKYDGVTR